METGGCRPELAGCGRALNGECHSTRGHGDGSGGERAVSSVTKGGRDFRSPVGLCLLGVRQQRRLGLWRLRVHKGLTNGRAQHRACRPTVAKHIVYTSNTLVEPRSAQKNATRLIRRMADSKNQKSQAWCCRQFTSWARRVLPALAGGRRRPPVEPGYVGQRVHRSARACRGLDGLTAAGAMLSQVEREPCHRQQP